jgi:ABC-type transport system involved in Fe-S cluster assembly fused permease/ATPase subunit
MTGVSAELRKIANEMDGVTTGKAVDALLNYETVSVFGNVKLESGQYDGLLRCVLYTGPHTTAFAW